MQDVGLIFLAAMASAIAEDCLDAGRDAATALGSSLLATAASTLLVGLGMLAVGESNLPPLGCLAASLQSGRPRA